MHFALVGLFYEENRELFFVPEKELEGLKKKIKLKVLLNCFQTAFRRDSSSKPSHLVRDQDCMVDGAGTPNQELQYGFVLPSPSVVSHCHPTTEHQPLSPNHLFQFRHCVTVPT
ncbi:hypothetical protein TNCV_3609771 [Trichonephila clavipes]|nr:hypothetical protein TNCV_3609771 [Trichonephila clavipes]